jgi:hypothetical protein
MRATLRFGVLLVIGGVLLRAEDPREIVRRSTEENRRNEKLAESYTFIERQEEHSLDSHGRIERRTVKTYDVTLTEGSPYRRLVARDDKPLPPNEERKERQKLEKSIAERRAETPQQREKRLADWRRQREHDRQFLREVPDAFDFRMAGEETVDGRPVYVIDATPRPDYRPKSTAGKFVPKMKGRLWIDQKTYDWVKTEAETIDTVSLGGFALRFSPGTRLTLLQVRVNDEIWLPKRISVKAQGRLLLLKKISGEVDLTYGDYKKFQSDSRIVATEEAR